MAREELIHRRRPGGDLPRTMCNLLVHREDAFGRMGKVGKDWDDVSCNKCQIATKPPENIHMNMSGVTACGITDKLKFRHANKATRWSKVSCEECLSKMYN